LIKVFLNNKKVVYLYRTKQVTMITQAHIQTMIQFTNAKIEAWYKEAFNSYGVKGAGKAHYNKANDEVVVEYTENGKQKTWKMAFYPEYLEDKLHGFITVGWN
jgi:hypothetical protein